MLALLILRDREDIIRRDQRTGRKCTLSDHSEERDGLRHVMQSEMAIVKKRCREYSFALEQ
jgi:hypothetical protein